MRKFERFVIYDEEMGVFLGHCKGITDKRLYCKRTDKFFIK